ncbi:hypothetical protein GF339_10600 [candidate division KSB3 bacterium]|uniref:Uncharacterized protein n=1 Tax=candidate division KSB3 bacterium TaxID=2044937 RepID=A0A9D5JVT4_9BACT|nr:hypothetical protein [candidate division KSB3 bacterium]MBD3325025.1 hypothetical protein [candidate division KSB3 bacterium]
MMWQPLYTALTAYEGMYIGYLAPVVYFTVLTVRTIGSRRARHHRLTLRDITVAIGLILIILDFLNYLYLLLTNTGELLPPAYLFPKYVLGLLVWLWVVWYSYQGYFARRAAGDQFRKRRNSLLWLVIATAVLAGVGIAIS